MLHEEIKCKRENQFPKYVTCKKLTENEILKLRKNNLIKFTEKYEFLLE